jgi:predicted nucleic acid-binding protein
MERAWEAYDRLFEDVRVMFVLEPPDLDDSFRIAAMSKAASPKLWADAYLLAFAEHAPGHVVTFDRALARRSPGSILLA